MPFHPHVKRPFCCPEPRCLPVAQIKDSEGWPDVSVPKPGESMFCFGMMPEPVTFTYDGVPHTNDLRSCTFTPLKGLVTFHENELDWEALASYYARALAKVRALRAEPGGEGGR